MKKSFCFIMLAISLLGCDDDDIFADAGDVKIPSEQQKDSSAEQLDASSDAASQSDASIEADGSADASTETDGSADASTETDGSEDASAETDGSEDASAETDGSEDASAETDGSEDASVETDGSEDASTETDASEDAGEVIYYHSCQELNSKSCFVHYDCEDDQVCANVAAPGDYETPCCITGTRGTEPVGADCIYEENEPYNKTCASGLCTAPYGQREGYCSDECTSDDDCPKDRMYCYTLMGICAPRSQSHQK